MTPERWKQVSQIYDAACARSSSARQAYLAEACAGDEALRREVQALLDQPTSAAGLEGLTPALVVQALGDAVATDLTGRRLGAYVVRERIGAGGMGEVYKAHDTRLDRTVAIKVLTAYLADDPQARERFQREARAVAALNHPHICTLHDVGSQNPSTGSGQPMDFLVMEYLDGQTLAERLAKGPLPLDRALRYAVQMADALDKAHRQGITHRDLKPANVMLTKAGTKLLDFGLAKLRPAVGEAVAMSAAANVSPSLTGRGTIVGTLQYMAPEQLDGKPADARTDIFAFGALLYEMLTGKKAFEGTSQASLISAILSSDPPPIASQQPFSPPALDRLVRKCLAKDPDERWQSTHDLTSELQWIAESGLQTAVTAHGVDAQVRSRARTQRYEWIAAAVFLVTTLALAGAMYVLRAPVDTRVYRSTFVPPGNENPSLPLYMKLSLSPDGRRLAFVANDANGRILLWVRELADLVGRPLEGTEGAMGPFWSPDSRFIAFSAGGKLKKIDASGGPAITLCDMKTGLAGSWGRGDVILFTPEPWRPLSRVPAAGGTPTPATTFDTKGGELWHGHPFFLPDGRHFLYAAAGAPTSGVYLGSLDSPDRTRLLDSFSNAQYGSGFLVFPRDGTLMAQPFDATRLALSGQAMAVAERVVYDRGVPPTGTLAAFAVSDTGALVFEASRTSRLVWFDRAGRQTGILGDPAPYGSGVHLSPDGSQAAAVVTDSTEAANVWLFDVARGVRIPLTTSGLVSSGFAPGSIWSPDGSHVVFASTQKGPHDLFQKASNGADPEDLLLADDFNKYPESWSPDGRFLLYTRWAKGSTPDIWVLPLSGDRKPYPFIEGPFFELAGRFSPNGRWVAYNSNESGRSEVYVVPFPGRGARTLISTGGGDNARWRRDGKEIFYLERNTLMAAGVAANGSRLEVGTVQRLFDVPTVDGYWPYDVTPDGQRFLVNTLESEVAPLTIVVNWPAGLKK
jgi:serine/threonine protein kinase/Tol biopolymer transport system component